MSEETEKLDQSVLVSSTDAVEFLSSRATSDCPSCGYNKWNIVSPISKDGSEVFSFVSAKKGGSHPDSKTLPLISAVCVRCAYVRSHAYNAVLAWVNSGKPEFTENET